MGKSTKYHLVHRSLALAVLAGLSACSAQQAYYGGQAWQRNECVNVIDTDERERCIAATHFSFQDYRSLEKAPAGCTGSTH